MYEIKTKVRFSETDSKSNLTINALVNYLQDIATFHSENSEFSLESMRDKKMGWMILSWDIKIERMPVLGEEITLQTMSVGFKGLYAYRDFKVLSGEEVLATAHSVWSIIDLERMLPRKMTDDVISFYGVEEKLPGEWSERKVPTPKEKELVSTARVEKYHLDSNGHMNNQYYINFALSAIEETSNISRIRVSYKQQVVLGEEIGIYLGKDVANAVTLEKDDRICAVVCFN